MVHQKRKKERKKIVTVCSEILLYHIYMYRVDKFEFSSKIMKNQIEASAQPNITM